MLDFCSAFSVRFFSVRPAWREFGRAALASALALLLVGQPVLAEAGVDSHSQGKAYQLTGEQRVEHALNRFTFGPRPGEVEEVEKIGLKRWFNQQLNPAAIDDSALDARLAEYPAMQLSVSDLVGKYPSPGMIRGMANGRISLPEDPTARALAQHEIEFYRLKQEGKASTGGRESSPQRLKPRMQAGSDGTAEAVPLSGAKESAAGEAVPSEQSARGCGVLDPTHRGETAMDGAPERPCGSDISALGGGDSFAGDGDAAARAEVRRLVGLAPAERLQAILALPTEDLIALRRGLKGPAAERLAEGMTPAQKETLVALGGSNRMVAAEAMDVRVLRDVESKRQLEAVMTDFWLNHFNVYVRKNQNEAYLLPDFERRVRANALGNFESLLVATAESPAMLEYLDNFRSIGADSQAARRVEMVRERNPNGKVAKAASVGLNENYGRELMELHTLGVNGGYSQADVTEVSEVLTGWTVDKPQQGGEFQFDERRHEPGSKTVLGKKIHEDGMKEGLEVLHMLATSPATAHFISEELAVRFVSDDPPPALVNRMAASFLASRGDIKTVLRTMFDSPEFWSPAVYHAKVKTPEEFVFSAARASDLQIQNPGALAQSLVRLGMPLYGMQTPNGYSWTKDDWVSTGALVSRMNFALVLSAGRLPGTSTDWDQVVGAGSVAAKEMRLETALLGEPVSARTRATVLAQAKDGTLGEQAETQFDLRGDGVVGKKARPVRVAASVGPPDRDPAAAVMAGLLIGSPEFQRR